METLAQKINPAAIDVEEVGVRFKHLVVNLREGQNEEYYLLLLLSDMKILRDFT